MTHGHKCTVLFYNIYWWKSAAYPHILFNVRLRVIPVRETLDL